VVTPRKSMMPSMTMPKLVDLCRELHGGADSALFAIMEDKGIKHVAIARRAFRELTDELLWIRKQLKAEELGSAGYYLTKNAMHDVEAAMDFIRFKFPDA
jgi:hypothetical protein